MDILFEKRGKISIITINRPSKMNALTFQMFNDLKMIFGEIRQDSDVNVVVITGAGKKAFCVGQDIKEFRNILATKVDSLRKSYWDTTGFNSILTDDTINKPVIAAINGQCIGYGLTLALSCDIRISSEKSSFCFPEVKIGMPTVIGAIKLPRVIALGPAMEMLLLGDSVKADEAYRLGLVNKLVDHDKVMQVAVELADKMAENDQIALKATKEIAIKSLRQPFNEVWRFGESLRNLALDHEKVQKSLNSILSKANSNKQRNRP